MTIKNHVIVETGPVQYPEIDQSKVPKPLRRISQLVKHNRSKRVGEKCDIGKPGKPPIW